MPGPFPGLAPRATHRGSGSTGRGLEPSVRPESGSSGPGDRLSPHPRGETAPTAPTPAAAGPRPAATPSERAASGAAGAAERAWARRPRAPGRAERIAGAITARPGHRRSRHHGGAGHGPGAGRRAGAALFPASPEASLALRWEPSRRASRIRQCCGEKRGRGGGGGGGRWGTERAGGRRGTPHRALSLPARSGRRPHASRPQIAPGSARSGRRHRARAGAEVLSAACAPRAEDPPRRTAPGLEAPEASGAFAAPGKWLRPCPTPVPALRRLLACRDSQRGPERAPDCTARHPRHRTRMGVRSCGRRWGARGLGLVALWGPARVAATLIRLSLLGSHSLSRFCELPSLGPSWSLRTPGPPPGPGCCARGGGVGRGAASAEGQAGALGALGLPRALGARTRDGLRRAGTMGEV